MKAPELCQVSSRGCMAKSGIHIPPKIQMHLGMTHPYFFFVKTLPGLRIIGAINGMYELHVQHLGLRLKLMPQMRYW